MGIRRRVAAGPRRRRARDIADPPGWQAGPADRAVAVTFIYTRCPLPQFCPLLATRFAELQRLVSTDANLKGRLRLLSVSSDPDADTPQVLPAHAIRLAADPLVWRFATGAEWTPQQVAEDLRRSPAAR